ATPSPTSCGSNANRNPSPKRKRGWRLLPRLRFGLVAVSFKPEAEAKGSALRQPKMAGNLRSREICRGRAVVMQIPAGRAERWALLKSLVAEWFRPLSEKDRLTKEELRAADEQFRRLLETQGVMPTARRRTRLPLALREWYELAGRAKDVWSSN